MSVGITNLVSKSLCVELSFKKRRMIGTQNDIK